MLELPDLEQFTNHPARALEQVAHALATSAQEWTFSSATRDSFALPKVTAKHPLLPGETPFRLMLRHTATIGLTEKNLAAIRKLSDDPNITVSEMTPPLRVAVGPALIMERPFSMAEVNLGLGRSASQESQVAYLEQSETEALSERLNGRLPSAHEWEAMCRCGDERIFPFGDSLIDEHKLKNWMEFDLNSKRTASNEFGFNGLFFGEWTSTFFTESHSNTSPQSSYRTIKGGGAYFWPWQDEEWVWCLCSMRMPSSDLDQGVATARLVLDL